MTKENKDTLLRLLRQHKELGISEQIDYEKFYLYSIITHSTAIEGSTVTEVEAQLLFDEGITSSKLTMMEQMMNLDLKVAYDYGHGWIKEHQPITVEWLIMLAAKVMARTGSEYHSIVPTRLAAFCEELNQRHDTEHQCPTYAAVVLFGQKPRRYMPGLYVQYVRFKGEDVTSEVENEMQLEGNYCELLPRLESLLELSVIKKKPVFVSILREKMVSNYPYTAIRELLLNACMHRDMQSNTPLRFYEFAGHLEILNAGGLYGNARPENFPDVNDYRNPLVASAMKTMGYVNMFNRGVGQVQTDLKENGNLPAEFNVNLITAFKVEVKVSQSYINESGGKDGGDNVPSLSPASSQVLSHVVTSLSQALSPVLSPVCPQLTDSLLTKISAVIVALSQQSYSISDLMEQTGEKNKNRFRQNELRPLLDAGLIELTIPNNPNSPKQKYALTEKGKRLFSELHSFDSQLS